MLGRSAKNMMLHSRYFGRFAIFAPLLLLLYITAVAFSNDVARIGIGSILIILWTLILYPRAMRYFLDVEQATPQEKNRFIANDQSFILSFSILIMLNLLRETYFYDLRFAEPIDYEDILYFTPFIIAVICFYALRSCLEKQPEQTDSPPSKI